ncbi:hypothetical protein A6770_27650 [Nostoc minutum NIES-26]|uniref:Oligosaccharide repeat unit polymerase n=1 Tax=Nostoc minutum NIES-26 TaxID=1844469 RepID=A0A367QQK0_9NOSO|nr:hypothetical protein A6770_27650 [Nostoc minutum NIES-26]
MNAEIVSRTKREGYIQNSSLILLAFSSAFFSRLLETVGFPSIINFLHFAIVPLAVGIVLLNSKTKNRYQIATTWTLLSGLAILLGVMLVSALVNKAGLINVVLDFLLLGEPFLLLVAVISIPMSIKRWERLETWLIRFGFINIILSYLQQYIIVPYFRQYLRTGLSGADLVQGVFFISGGGNTLAGGISMFFSAYYFQKANDVPLWQRVMVLLASLWQVIFSDTKQVILVFLIAWSILSLIKIKNIRKVLMSVIGIVLLVSMIIWGTENLEAFRAFKTYLSPEVLNPSNDTTQIKLLPLSMIPSYYQSSLNWLFGLGPGHTVGRLGQGMLSKYDSLFTPLGATYSPIGSAVWDKFALLAGGNGTSSISTVFSPFWGWAGIWGDLGFVGLGAYLYLGYLVWSRLWGDDFAQFLLLNVLIFGFMSTQLEEPGFMLYIAIMVGLRWQEKRLENYKS